MSIKNSLSRSIHIDLHRFIYESPSKPTDKLVIVPQHCCALEKAHTAKKIKICLLQRARGQALRAFVERFLFPSPRLLSPYPWCAPLTPLGLTLPAIKERRDGRSGGRVCSFPSRSLSASQDSFKRRILTTLKHSGIKERKTLSNSA